MASPVGFAARLPVDITRGGRSIHLVLCTDATGRGRNKLRPYGIDQRLTCCEWDNRETRRGLGPGGRSSPDVAARFIAPDHR